MKITKTDKINFLKVNFEKEIVKDLMAFYEWESMSFNNLLKAGQLLQNTK